MRELALKGLAANIASIWYTSSKNFDQTVNYDQKGRPKGRLGHKTTFYVHIRKGYPG